MGSVPKKSHVFAASVPIYGHVEKIKVVAAALVKLGYPVTFLTGSQHRQVIESTGAKFVPFEGKADFDNEKRGETHPEYSQIPPGLARLRYELREFFIAPVADQHNTFQREFAKFREEHPGAPIIVVHENAMIGLIPVLLGAPGIRPDAVITLGITPMTMASVDTGPFGAVMPPDSSPEGRVRNQGAHAHFKTLFADVQEFWESRVRSLGVKGPLAFLLGEAVSIPDRFYQMCARSLEYPRSDEPKNFRYIGAIAGTGINQSTELPSWWDEVTSHRKPLVVVSQGSVSNDENDLILPAIEGLKDLDVLVVSTLVKSDGIEGFKAPDNVRIAKFIPFDELFKYTDIVVNNGGYGTVQQAFIRGCPMVLAGEGEDKPETNARAAWTGAAINLKTQRPTSGQVKNAVQEMLKNPSYKENAMRLSEDYKNCDPIGAITLAIDEYAEGRALTSTDDLVETGTLNA